MLLAAAFSALGVVAVLGPVTPARAQLIPADTWTPPQQLSPRDELAFFATLVTDPTGGLHVAWSGADDAFDFTVYSSSRDGQNWSAPIDIVAMRLGPNGESYVSRPVLSAGPDGALLLGHHGQEDESFLYTS
ncbi:MAG: hypothetical protein ACRC1H_10985, partial [Caldilineaceae bacterium]